MSLFHGGQLRTMRAHYQIDAGDLRVIRPLVYARERQTRDFSRMAELPVIVENCPTCFAKPTERQRMKNLLADLEMGDKHLFSSLLSAIKPLLHDNKP